MPTHAELASRLLMDAAQFFRTLGAQNAPLKAQMEENAALFDQMARLLATDPKGSLGDKPCAEMAARLLADAAGFFRGLAEKNESVKELMEENADAYEQISGLVRTDPLGILD